MVDVWRATIEATDFWSALFAYHSFDEVYYCAFCILKLALRLSCAPYKWSWLKCSERIWLLSYFLYTKCLQDSANSFNINAIFIALSKIFEYLQSNLYTICIKGRTQNYSKDKKLYVNHAYPQ